MQFWILFLGLFPNKNICEFLLIWSDPFTSDSFPEKTKIYCRRLLCFAESALKYVTHEYDFEVLIDFKTPQ